MTVEKTPESSGRRRRDAQQRFCATAFAVATETGGDSGDRSGTKSRGGDRGRPGRRPNGAALPPPTGRTGLVKPKTATRADAPDTGRPAGTQEVPPTRLESPIAARRRARPQCVRRRPAPPRPAGSAATRQRLTRAELGVQHRRSLDLLICGSFPDSGGGRRRQRGEEQHRGGDPAVQRQSAPAICIRPCSHPAASGAAPACASGQGAPNLYLPAPCHATPYRPACTEHGVGLSG